MGEVIGAMLEGAGSLMDVTGTQGTRQLKERHRILRQGVIKHKGSMKSHFDRAYTKLI